MTNTQTPNAAKIDTQRSLSIGQTIYADLIGIGYDVVGRVTHIEGDQVTFAIPAFKDDEVVIEMRASNVRTEIEQSEFAARFAAPVIPEIICPGCDEETALNGADLCETCQIIKTAREGATLEGYCPDESECPKCGSIWSPEITGCGDCPDCMPQCAIPTAIYGA